MMEHNKYHIQDGCHNCRFVFRKYDYDDMNLYYCTLNAPKRPPCGSAWMSEDDEKENWSDRVDDDLKEFKKDMNRWETWSKNREVNDCGICNKYVGK